MSIFSGRKPETAADVPPPLQLVIDGVACKQLRNRDLDKKGKADGGASDPFIRLRLVQPVGTLRKEKELARAETPHISNEANPSWPTHRLVVPLPPGGVKLDKKTGNLVVSAALLLEVFDHEDANSPQSLGRLEPKRMAELLKNPVKLGPTGASISVLVENHLLSGKSTEVTAKVSAISFSWHLELQAETDPRSDQSQSQQGASSSADGAGPSLQRPSHLPRRANPTKPQIDVDVVTAAAATATAVDTLRAPAAAQVNQQQAQQAQTAPQAQAAVGTSKAEREAAAATAIQSQTRGRASRSQAQPQAVPPTAAPAAAAIAVAQPTKPQPQQQVQSSGGGAAPADSSAATVSIQSQPQQAQQSQTARRQPQTAPQAQTAQQAQQPQTAQAAPQAQAAVGASKAEREAAAATAIQSQTRGRASRTKAYSRCYF
ncbi:hypothetical protein T492DRAFT_878715 [Pavlovales sp. CCMP2436]|nr:hypothetical protein T492DRAFT_878715 [Pavlovales sp. CCMP2436]